MRYKFSHLEIDTDTREFRNSGELRNLEPQVFDLLIVLIENSGRILSRDELMEKVWAGRIVSDATIDARINALRKAVGDTGKTQSVIKTIPRRGFRFIADMTRVIEESVNSEDFSVEQQPRIQFGQSADGTRIAFAQLGSGPPLVRSGHWLTHLEYDWQCPIWQPFLRELCQTYSLLQYDQRGNGLSDWDVEDLSLDAFVSDLKTVVDSAGLDRFPIIASSQGVPVAVAFAAHYPERVSRLVLHGGYVKGRLLRADAAEREKAEAFMTLMRNGWGTPGSPFLQAFSSFYIPDGGREYINSLAEQQLISVSPENSIRLRRAFDTFDVTKLLPKIVTPTLVIHARGDSIQPLDQGRELAAAIRGAELIVLESRNHAILPHEKAWPVFFETVRRHIPF